MRRHLVMIFILFFSLSCVCFSIPLFEPASTNTPTAAPTLTASFPPLTTPTPLITPTRTSIVETPTTTVQTATPPGEPFTVLYHPDGGLYVGDQVSMEVISPPGLELKDAKVQLQVDSPAGPTMGPVDFSAWGIQGREEATLLWAWDTKEEPPGVHSLAFSVQPEGYSWTEQVTLLPASDLPSIQEKAKWASTQSQCCTVFYITNTAAERDLSALVTQVDDEARSAIEQMDSSFTLPITVTVLPRLLGHGGFTSSDISVSYLDRNYAANTWTLVLHHEIIHVIDGHLGGDFRPTIFVEGLAVYMTGGHYKPEPLMPRAAALLKDYLNLYIPLNTLSNDFYGSQHEIGYMEGASLIEYMVNTYGWDAFSTFYRDIHIKQGESQSDAIDAALRAHFSISFDQLEQDFLAALTNEPDAALYMDDVRLTVTYYDSVRRYQQLLDPSAYFRTAWLLDNKTMRERGIVADYLRHPNAPSNLALETLLITANQQMTDQHYSDADQTLNIVNSVLDAIEQQSNAPFSVSPLAADYLAICSTLDQQGYDVQRLTFDSNSAVANVTTMASLDLVKINLVRKGNEWLIAP